MVAKKKSKQSSSKKSKGSPAKPIDGLKKANALRRQLERWREQPWPLTEQTAPEWLRLGHALKAQAEAIIGESLRLVNPTYFPKSNMEVARARAGVDSS